MRQKIEIGTRLWVTERSDYTYCTEMLVYTLHPDTPSGGHNIYAVDTKGKTYHMIYADGKFDLDKYSVVTFKRNDVVDLVTPLTIKWN